jgi:hypothetical protein
VPGSHPIFDIRRGWRFGPKLAVSTHMPSRGPRLRSILASSALAIVLGGCASSGRAPGSGTATGNLLTMGAIGVIAAADGASRRQRTSGGSAIDYPADAYLCTIDAFGGEEIRAASEERAHESCVAIHGERSSASHCRCRRLADLHVSR